MSPIASSIFSTASFAPPCAQRLRHPRLRRRHPHLDGIPSGRYRNRRPASLRSARDARASGRRQLPLGRQGASARDRSARLDRTGKRSWPAAAEDRRPSARRRRAVRPAVLERPLEPARLEHRGQARRPLAGCPLRDRGPPRGPASTAPLISCRLHVPRLPATHEIVELFGVRPSEENLWRSARSARRGRALARACLRPGWNPDEPIGGSLSAGAEIGMVGGAGLTYRGWKSGRTGQRDQGFPLPVEG